MLGNPLEFFAISAGPDTTTEPPDADRVERRQRVRTRVHWRVLLFRNQTSEAVESLTQDLSSHGFYCLSRDPFTPGERLHCTLRVPAHDPGGDEAERTLDCLVRVMRVDPAAVEKFYGIACRIEDYRLAHGNSAGAL
jgi:hypothetical protein